MSTFRYEELTPEDRIALLEARVKELESNPQELRGLETNRVQAEAEIAMGLRPQSDIDNIDAQIRTARGAQNDRLKKAQGLIDQAKTENKEAKKNVNP